MCPEIGKTSYNASTEYSDTQGRISFIDSGGAQDVVATSSVGEDVAEAVRVSSHGIAV